MAALTSWQYARLRVRQAKTGQRVRLAAVITASVGGSFNDVFPWGLYGRTSERLAYPYFAYSNYPTPPFEHDTAIAGAAGCTQPRFCWDHARRSLILTCLDGTDVVSRRSDDDAYSWFLPGTALFTSAGFPDVSSSREGLILYSANVAGALRVRRQHAGDSTPAVAFSAEDDGGAPLILASDSHRIVAGHNGFWYLHALLDGETDTTLLQSYDDGESFAQCPGAVTGVANGEHPGIAVTPTGELVAWAYVAGSGFLTRRAPGDTAWSTPVEMEDESGPLAFTDADFSIAGAYEGSSRLVLAAVLDGESLPAELWSADGGATWTRFPMT